MGTTIVLVWLFIAPSSFSRKRILKQTEDYLFGSNGLSYELSHTTLYQYTEMLASQNSSQKLNPNTRIFKEHLGWFLTADSSFLRIMIVTDNL